MAEPTPEWFLDHFFPDPTVDCVAITRLQALGLMRRAYDVAENPDGVRYPFTIMCHEFGSDDDREEVGYEQHDDFFGDDDYQTFQLWRF